MITKKLFTKIITDLKTQREKDQKYGKAIEKMFDSQFAMYDNLLLHDALINLLKIIFKDNSDLSWIDYYIYELDFGAKYTDKSCSYKNGDIIDISTPEALYDFLISEMDNSND